NGYLLTANTKTTTTDYPHYLSYVATPYRADRLRELLEAREAFGVAQMAAMQGDQTSAQGRGVAQEFGRSRPGTAAARLLVDTFAARDANLAPDSPAALALDAGPEAR